MAEIAGYRVQVRMTGTPTAMTDEACSLVSGKTYQITNTAKRILDWTASVVVEDNGVAVSAANIETIDYLFGKVTFVTAYTVTGPVTITATYLPTSAIAYAKSFDVQFSRDVLDSTVFTTGNGYRKKFGGLLDSSGSIGYLGFLEEEINSETLIEKFDAGTTYLLEIDPDGDGTEFRRILVKFNSIDPNADVGGLVEDTLSWVGAPAISDDGYPVSFGFGT